MRVIDMPLSAGYAAAQILNDNELSANQLIQEALVSATTHVASTRQQLEQLCFQNKSLDQKMSFNDNMNSIYTQKYKQIKMFENGNTQEPHSAILNNTPTLSSNSLSDYDGDDDHSMIVTNTKEEICTNDNNGDECLTSSSNNSLRSSKRLYFPHGIINPNYPGFQHLAHTLTENFVGIPSDSYDSDFSECDMELSTDSVDDLPPEEDAELYNQQNNNNTINNANGQHSSFTQRSKVANISILGHKKLIDTNCNIHDDLPYNAENGITTVLSSPKLIPNLEWNMEYIAEPMENVASKISSWNTPDILVKNYTTRTITQRQNCPDLLRGVSPCEAKDLSEATSTNTANDEKVMQPVQLMPANQQADNYSKRNTDAGSKDELMLGLTPVVDIIGDFGLEVEREFGLIVSGYRKLKEEQECVVVAKQEALYATEPFMNVTDAVLSNANEQIETKMMTNCVSSNEPHTNDVDKSPRKTDLKHNQGSSTSEDSFDVDVPMEEDEEQDVNAKKKYNDMSTSGKSKYQKSSHDDRQLPPIAIDYKRCKQSLSRTPRKQQNLDTTAVNVKDYKQPKASTARYSRGSELFPPKSDKTAIMDNKKRAEAELNQYKQLINDKEFILSKSKYANLSSWAQYLKNSGSSQNSLELISPSALNLFDAYRVGTELDIETLQKHLELAKEIEKKRRNDREEIRRRLAIGADETGIELNQKKTNLKPSIQTRLQNGFQIGRFRETSPDTESHSSDSETCPKLSKSKAQSSLNLYGGGVRANDYSAAEKPKQHFSRKHGKQQSPTPQEPVAISIEDKECEFFTKQAKLQIEARMALAQAKDMAHMQMEIDRQNQRISPITEIVRNSLTRIGVQMTADKRRVSRQMLTEMSIGQQQVLVNNIHMHIERFNEMLVHVLMERDDLHMAQDSILIDIEDLTRYIAMEENLEHNNADTTMHNQPT